MAGTEENHTIKLLQEMRKEMKTEIKELRVEMNTRFDGLTHVMMLLASNAHQHENRLEKLETKRPQHGS